MSHGGDGSGMKRAAGYVSRRAGGTEEQKEIIKQYCLEHDYVLEWLDVPETDGFGSVAYGGWLTGRKVDAVVVADSDAVTDDFFEFYAYKSVLKRRHCDLVAVKSEFTGYKLYRSVAEKLVDKICEVELRNEPLRKPHDRMDKAARGQYIGGRAPMGYRVEGGKLVVNPEEVPVVLYIMERKHQGCSMLSTVDALNTNGYKTRNGKPFVISTVASIWNNEMLYRGYYRYSGSGKYGEWVPGEHEAILKD